MLHNQSPIDSYAGCRWLFLIRYLLRKSSAGCVISKPPRWRSRSGEKCKVIELGSNEVVVGHRTWMMCDSQLILEILAMVSTLYHLMLCMGWFFSFTCAFQDFLSWSERRFILSLHPVSSACGACLLLHQADVFTAFNFFIRTTLDSTGSVLQLSIFPNILHNGSSRICLTKLGI